jgi:hypothetical protein
MRNATALPVSLLLATVAFAQSQAPVVINEFAYDDTQANDVREFVELYNRTSQPVDVSGWILECVNGTTRTVHGTYTIPANTVLAPGAFWVMGTAIVPNVNQVLGTTNLFYNEVSALTLYTPARTVVDTLYYESNKLVVGGQWTPWAPNLVEGQGVWGNNQSVDAYPTSCQRLLDGFDTNDNGRDFRLIALTPGTTNNVTAPMQYVNLFDQLAPDSPVAGFSGSFRPPYAVNPTLVTTWNPKAVAASPQGGNAMVVWDIAGGGNSVMFDSAPALDGVFEAYVYFDATLKTGNDHNETWSIGFQGTTCTFFNTPDPSRAFGFAANGNTGVSLTYQISQTSSTLYLIDHNNGGIDWTVLGSLLIQPNVNDGWRRLRLEVKGDRVNAFLGGTFSCGDGAWLGGRLKQPGIGGFYIGFRENVVSLGDHPFLCDQMTLRLGQAEIGTIGQAVATTVGTPTLDFNGLPTIGFSGFQAQLSGLVPARTTLLLLGTSQLVPPLDLSLLGGQQGSFLHLLPVITASLPTDAQGRTTLTLPIPCNPTWAGVSLYWQNFDFDPALAVPLKLGNSVALKTTFGS